MTSKLFKYLTGKLFQYFSLIIKWPVIMVFLVQTFQEFVLQFFFSIIQSGKLDEFHEFQFAFCFILKQAPEQGLFLDSSKTNFYFLKCIKSFSRNQSHFFRVVESMARAYYCVHFQSVLVQNKAYFKSQDCEPSPH